MPPPRQNLIKVHLSVDRSDWYRLKEVYGRPGSKISPSKAVRIAIARFLIQHEAIARNIIDEGEN